VSPLLVAWFAACAVLVVAGAAKLRKPDPTVGALRGAGIPAGHGAVRALAVGEIVLGSSAILTGAPIAAAAVAAVYLGFAGFVAASLRSGRMVQTCGCFGSPDVPATRGHVAINVACAAVGLAAAATTPASLSEVLDEGPAGATLVLLSAVATFEIVILLAVQPLVRAARLGGRPATREPAAW
jgi:uncharacterized membrane protein YphA (DoxX/SURF4 family)